MTLNKCAVLWITTLTGGPPCRKSHPLCRLKNPTVVYMITCRLSSCKTGVYNVHLLIILERWCSSTCMYRTKERKGEKKAHGPTGTRTQDLSHTVGALWPLSCSVLLLTCDSFPPASLELLDCPRICSEPCRNRRESPFAACTRSTDPHWTIKCHRGGKSTWPTGTGSQDLSHTMRALWSLIFRATLSTCDITQREGFRVAWVEYRSMVMYVP